MDLLGILLKSKLDINVKEINDQIQILQDNPKLQALTLKVNLNNAEMQEIIEKARKAKDAIEKDQIKFASFSDANKQMKEMLGDLERIRQHFNGLGENLTIKQMFDEGDLSLRNFEVSVDNIINNVKETTRFKVELFDNAELGETELILKNIGNTSKELREKPKKEPIIKKEEVQDVQQFNAQLQQLLHLRKTEQLSLQEFINLASAYRQDAQFTNLTKQEQVDLVNALNSAEKEYSKILNEKTTINKKYLDQVHAQALVENKQYDKNIKMQKETIGVFKELAKEQLNASDVAKVVSKEYGNLEIRGQSLNKTTGQYTVTLKQSAKENLTVKGTVDQLTGSLRIQSQVVQQAKNVQLGFWEQFKIAAERVPKLHMGTLNLL